ncbi:MAG: hypothetical protein ACI4N3_04180 [Alphaproteobacteria bacterium]
MKTNNTMITSEDIYQMVKKVKNVNTNKKLENIGIYIDSPMEIELKVDGIYKRYQYDNIHKILTEVIPNQK